MACWCATARATPCLETDQVLVAVGRKPNTQGWNLEALNLDMNGAAIKIDDRCQTSMRNVWAIGDLSGEPMLAHRAMAQGEMVAELISGKHREFNRPPSPPCASPTRNWWWSARPRRGQGCRAGLHRFAASRSPPMAGP
jgi:pyruvate/2-oxoglutarate dehydrogenase complex dihydrolipoamide dehydrogenase (E3) component